MVTPENPQPRASRLVTRLQPVLAGLLFLLLTILLTWPNVPRLATAVPDLGDPLETVWTLNWIASRLPFDLGRLYDAPIFSSWPLALAYDDTSLAPGVLAWLLNGITGNSLLSYNLIMLGCYVANALAVWALARYVTRSAAAGVVAGIGFSFSTYCFAHISHLNLLSFFPLPLALLALHGWLDQAGSPETNGAFLWRFRLPLLFAGASILMALCSFYYFAYLAVASLLVVVWWALVVRGWRGWEHGHWRVFIGQGFVVLALLGITLLAISAPYRAVSNNLGLTRTQEEQEQGAARPLDYISVSPRNSTYAGHLPQAWPEPLFLGATLTVLTLLSGVLALRNRITANRAGAKSNPRWLVYYLALAVVGLLLSFGPTLVIGDLAIPMPYRLLDLLPGSAALRGPARLVTLVLLGMGVFGGWAAPRIIAVLPQRRVLAAPVLLLLVALMCFEQLTIPQPSVEVAPDGVPGSYRWLAAQPRGVLAEFPISLGLADPTVTTERMFFQGTHRQPLLNGYASFIPPGYHEIVVALDGGILEKGGDRLSVRPQDVGILQSLGVRYMMFDRTLKFYKKADWKSITSSIAEYPELRFAAKFDDDWLYSIYLLDPLPEASRMMLRYSLPAQVAAGNVITLSLRIDNPYKYPLLSRLEDTLQLEARWIAPSGAVAHSERLKVATPLTLDPGAHTLSLELVAPGNPGDYALELHPLAPAPPYATSERIEVTVLRTP